MDDLSLWEAQTAMNGWKKAQGIKEKPRAHSEEEHDRLMAKYA